MSVQVDEAPVATEGVLTQSLEHTDPAVFAAIADELTRQQSTLEMIASENFAPLAVMQAQGGRGVREWRRAHPAQVQALALEHARCTTDVDTPEDLRRLGERWGVWIRPPRPADPAAP